MTQTAKTFHVDCPSCYTSFPVDPAKVPDEGVLARCSACQGVFRVQKPEDDFGAHLTPDAPPMHEDTPGVGASEDEAPSDGGHDAADGWAAEGSVTFEDAAIDVSDEPVAFGDAAIDVSDEAEPFVDVGDDLSDDLGAAPPTGEAGTFVGTVDEPAGFQDRADAVIDEPIPVSDAPEVGFDDPLTFDDSGDLGVETPGAFDDTTETATEEPVAWDAPAEATTEEPVAWDAPTDAGVEAPPMFEGTEDAGVGEAIPFADTAFAEPQATTDAAPDAAGPAPMVFGKRDPKEKAQRLARVLVSDMITYNKDRHAQALAQGTLVEDFEDEIKKSWAEYVDQVGEDVAEGTPFFTDALNEILAQGEPVF